MHFFIIHHYLNLANQDQSLQGPDCGDVDGFKYIFGVLLTSAGVDVPRAEEKNTSCSHLRNTDSIISFRLK